GVLLTTINSGMTPPLTFIYYKDFINNIDFIHSNVAAMSDTAYGLSFITYVEVQDDFGHTLWLNSNISLPFYVDYPVINQPVCPDTMGSVLITINSGNQPMAVEWYNYNSGDYLGAGNPMDFPVGNFYFVVVDSNGCNSLYLDSLSYLHIEQTSNINFSVSTTDASCTDGTAAIHNITGAVSPYSYQWSNGMTTDSISNLMMGSYSVTITDSLGCHRAYWTYINQTINIGINPVVTPASCLQNDGSIITFGSGGQPPYSYTYSNGAHTQTATGLAGEDYYYVTITDADGCIGIGNIYVNTSTPITVTYTATPSFCTAPTGAAYLTISGGQLPYTIEWSGYPTQTDTFLTNVPAGNYHFMVTDQNGCIRSGTIHIPDVGNLGGYFTGVLGNCSGNTSLTFNAFGSNPPFSYSWNTGDTTQTISGLSPGCYTVTITDTAGCSLGKFICINPGLTLGFSTQQASCLYVNDGVITANVSGGVPPYSYSWHYLYHSNYSFPNAQTISGLHTGYYGLYVHDANGCWNYDTVYVDYDHSNDSCYCTVTGKVFVDDNSNCVYDAGEETVPNIMIHLDSLGYTFTDTGGVYSIKVPAGNYTLSEMVQYYYPLAPCQNNQISLNINPAPGCTLTYDFANVINPIHDLIVIAPQCERPVIGNIYSQRLLIINAGTITEDSVQVGYAHDGQLTYLSSGYPFVQNDPVNSPDWYSINTGFPSLPPGYYASGFVNYFVPTNIPLGTEINFTDTVAYDTIPNWLNDYTPWNNVRFFNAITVASYDPNFKEVFPQGAGPQGYISTNDTELVYVVHFENTGTYYADKVVVVDSLDANLDITTLRPLYATHNFRADLDENNILTFTFDHIHLPYTSYSSGTASRGMIAFSIKLKPQLPIGTVIRNKADIYFDYNSPVTTNTVVNTITDSVVNIEEQMVISDILLYPNPSSSAIWIRSDFVKDISAYTIYDLTGRIIIRNRQVNTPEINVETLTNGIYFIEITDKNGRRQVAKFVKN
ncbi:MAG: T9SS type A sorting domain-containing protein, partial [Bacteroidales bacterium]|nr:T9SS type A sorting domain-containing protein [Bacteroidales bacterium]